MNILKKSVAVCLATTITIATSLTTFANTDAVIKKIDELMGYSYGTMCALNDALKTDFIISKYNEVKSSVKEVIDDTYKNESGWWNEYLALPIYFGVLSGYEDGTLKPNQSVKASEVAKIVATAYEPIIKEVDGLNNADFDGQWYNKYYNTIARAFTYTESTLMTPEYMNSNMRRCEIAYVLANVCNDGTLDSYIAKAKQGDISQMAGYVDFNNIVDVPSSMENELTAMQNGQIPARYAGAVMYLQAKGIMVGDGAGHISPLDNVSRAEVFKLIQTTCQNTVSYTKNQFYGWETGKVEHIGGGGVQTPSNVMSLDTVLNPNAPAELQYKVRDLKVQSGVSPEADLKYVLNGARNPAEKQLGVETTTKIIEMQKQKVQINGNKVSIDMVDLQSDYHEIQVMVIYEDGDDVIYRSSADKGHIDVPEKKLYSVSIKVVGNKNTVAENKTAGSSRTYYFEEGSWSLE